MNNTPGLAKLIINADDFGLTVGVNEGIIDAHEAGIVTSTTLMTNMPAAAHAVELASGHPSLGVGVHINLTSGHAACPLDDLEDLVDANGKLPSLFNLVTKAWQPESVVSIRREIRAQAKRAIDAGVKVTHMDSHKHVMILPVVLEASMSVAREFGIKAIRVPVEDKPLSKIVACSMSGAGRAKISAVRLLARRARKILKREGFDTVDWFLGVARTGDWDAPALATAILSLKPGVTEIMMHPGKVDDELRALPTRLTDSRQRELDMLCAEGIRSAVEVSGVRLITYGNLAEYRGRGDRT